MKVFRTEEKCTVDNYPYGRLRTEATFGLEFKPKNGFRRTFQTVNPKTGRINNPKKSTYRQVMRMVQLENGRVDYLEISFYNSKDFDRNLEFINKHWDTFTEAERKYIYHTILVYLVTSVKAGVIYCNQDKDKTIALYDQAIKTTKQGLKTGDNVLADIKVDFDAVDALKDPDYNPFTVKQVA